MGMRAYMCLHACVYLQFAPPSIEVDLAGFATPPPQYWKASNAYAIDDCSDMADDHADLNHKQY